MDAQDTTSTDSGWRVVGGSGVAGSSSSSRSAANSQRRPGAPSSTTAPGHPHTSQWPQVASASRSGHATPWSGYATPQSGYASPRSGYASPRILPQRGRPPPALALSSARASPHTSTSQSALAKAKTARELSNAGNISRASTPGLKQPTKHVPTDVVIEILRHYARISPSCAVNALVVSKSLSSSLEEATYGNVSLFTVSAMASFHELIKSKPEIGRKVKALWIAPATLKSDLIPCLAPPTSNAANDARQRKVQGLARDILRSCRRLDHLALDGGFLTPQSATAFGTACKPKTLLCVNPHSFLGHFSAPIFRNTVRRLEIVDTTLAVEEVDEIRQMQGLHAFVWTSPRANTDVTRDVSVLLRILSPRASDISALQESDGVADQTLVDILAASGNALPDRTRQNDKLQSICTATSHARAAALAASFKKVVESITVHDEDADRSYSHGQDQDEDIDDITRAMRAVRAGGGVYVDSSMSQSSALHAPSGVELQTEALSSLMHALAVAQKPQARTQSANVSSRAGRGKVDASADYSMERPEESDDDSEEEDGNDTDDYDTDDDDDDDDEVVEEWEALRDVVCQRRTANSTTSSRYFAGVGTGSVGGHGGMSGSGLLVRSTGPGSVRSTVTGSGAPSTTASGISTPAAGWASQAVSTAVSRAASRAASPSLGGAAGGDEIDGGRALQRIWRRWRNQVNTGAWERFVC